MTVTGRIIGLLKAHEQSETRLAFQINMYELKTTLLTPYQRDDILKIGKFF